MATARPGEMEELYSVKAKIERRALSRPKLEHSQALKELEAAVAVASSADAASHAQWFVRPFDALLAAHQEAMRLYEAAKQEWNAAFPVSFLATFSCNVCRLLICLLCLSSKQLEYDELGQLRRSDEALEAKPPVPNTAFDLWMRDVKERVPSWSHLTPREVADRLRDSVKNVVATRDGAVAAVRHVSAALPTDAEVESIVECELCRGTGKVGLLLDVADDAGCALCRTNAKVDAYFRNVFARAGDQMIDQDAAKALAALAAEEEMELNAADAARQSAKGGAANGDDDDDEYNSPRRKRQKKRNGDGDSDSDDGEGGIELEPLVALPTTKRALAAIESQKARRAAEVGSGGASAAESALSVLKTFLSRHRRYLFADQSSVRFAFALFYI